MADTPPPLEPATFLREQVAPRPGRRIETLRTEIARLERELADRLGAQATVQLVLEGDGGGEWYLNLREGEMRVGDRPDSPPLVRVYQSREDWEALTRAELAAGGGAPPAADLTRSRLERLRGLEGTMEFRLGTGDGEAAAERRIVVQFGQGERAAPRCTISMRADHARRLQSGELAPQAAFMQGLVKLQGDVAFAMQVGAALF